MPRKPRPDSPSTSITTSRRRVLGRKTCLSSMSRPDICRIIRRRSMSPILESATFTPFRSTVTSSHRSKISSSLWEMKMMLRPSPRNCRITSKRREILAAVRLVVGSSRIRIL